MFDVIVMPNLYGDILSDVAAQITGSVGIAGSANIGEHVAMFEAIHGSAPDLARKGVANPSGLLLAGVMMLNHLGQSAAAQRVHNAWLRTVEDGIHTADLAKGDGATREVVGTEAFARAVIERLGSEPRQLAPVRYTANAPVRIAPVERRPRQAKKTVGVDLFVHWSGEDADALAQQLRGIEGGPLELKMITNRGVKVWPGGFPETFRTDHWRCRFMNGGGPVALSEIAALQARAAEAGVEFIKTEHLCEFDGEAGYSLGQGQ
jgi:isocitrate dehydrogenase